MSEEDNNWRKKSTGFFRKPKIVSRERIEVTCEVSVELIEFETGKDIKDVTVIEAFPGATLTSILVGGYLRETLDLDLVAIIKSPHFPPRCLIENGVPVHPVRIFANKQVAVALCEFKLPTPELINGVVRAVLKWAKNHTADLMIAVEGLPIDDLDDPKKTETLAFVSTQEAFMKTMTKLGHEPLENSVMVGVAGASLAEATTEDIEVACLVAPTAAKFPDARSAVVCVKAIDEYLEDVSIDTAPLERKAEALQESVRKLLKQEASETKAAGNSSMYL